MIKTTLTGSIPVVLFVLGLVYVPTLILGVMLTVVVFGLCFVVGSMIRGEVIR